MAAVFSCLILMGFLTIFQIFTESAPLPPFLEGRTRQKRLGSQIVFPGPTGGYRHFSQIYESGNSDPDEKPFERGVFLFNGGNFQKRENFQNGFGGFFGRGPGFSPVEDNRPGFGALGGRFPVDRDPSSYSSSMAASQSVSGGNGGGFSGSAAAAGSQSSSAGGNGGSSSNAASQSFSSSFGGFSGSFSQSSSFSGSFNRGF